MKNNVIFGARAIMEAIKAGKDVEKVMIKSGAERSGLVRELFDMSREYELSIQFVPVERLDRVTPYNHQGVNHQGAVAFLSMIEFHSLEKVVMEATSKGRNPLILILDRVSDVRNFGAIARSAEVAGVDAIVVPEQGAAQINGDAIKTSAGALHTIPVCKEKNLKDSVMLLQQMGIKCVAATEKGADIYSEVDLSSPLAIIMGAEDKGVSKTILKIVDDLVKIPQFGKIESLNVSVAAGVILFDAVRQRNLKV